MNILKSPEVVESEDFNLKCFKKMMSQKQELKKDHKLAIQYYAAKKLTEYLNGGKFRLQVLKCFKKMSQKDGVETRSQIGNSMFYHKEMDSRSKWWKS